MLDQAPNLLLREAQEIQVNGASTTSTPRIHALTLPLWCLGSTLWCDVIAARRNCLWNWFLVVCLPAGPVAYAWFARWVYCLISLMMVASWLKEQCFAGISSCICSPNGWFCLSRKRHLAAICDANRYGKLPRLVGQVSDQLPGEVCILCEILYVSLMSNGLQERGACYFPEAWIDPHVLARMEARSIKSKQFGLLSRPALLKFEVYHGSMSEGVWDQSPLYQVVKSITRGVVVVFSVKLVHKHEW